MHIGLEINGCSFSGTHDGYCDAMTSKRQFCLSRFAKVRDQRRRAVGAPPLIEPHRRRSLCFPGWPRIVLWKCVSDVVPRSLGADKHVISGTNSRVIIEWTQSEAAELATARYTKTGSADAAEGPAHARGRFVDRQKVLTCQPTKIPGAYLCVGCKRRSMKSSTHRAMAVTHIGKRTIHLVTHCATKATALYFHAAESSVA